MYKLWIGVLSLLWISSACVDPDFKRSMTEGYPELYEAVFERDAQAILSFTQHEDSLVRVQAWRALISTPVHRTEIVNYIDAVAEANTPQSWASLWRKDLGPDGLEKLHTLWEEQPALRAGLASALGETGNSDSFRLLMETPVISDDDMAFEHALALGRLSMRTTLTEEDQIELIDRALSTTDVDLSTAYLYGMYRRRMELSAGAQNHLLTLWENYYPEDHRADQYISRLLMEDHMDKVLYHFPIESYQDMNVQLAIEIAQGIGVNEQTDYAVVIVNALLDHRNPNVQIAALQAIQQKDQAVADRLQRSILNKTSLNVEADPRVQLVGFNTITDPSSYEEEVNEIAGNDPYLQSLRYQILKKIYSDADFFDVLSTDINAEDRLIRFYALQELNNWWTSASDEFKTPEQTEEVKAVFLEALETVDRSMMYVMQNLFMDESLIANNEYSVLENLLSRFQLPEDVEVYQSVSQVLKSRFEEQAYPLIDSLASEGNMALNRTLLDQGWDILQGDYYPTEFRNPNWNRLTRLGMYPELVLDTQKGDIRIRMDVLRAPVTIAGMNSLVESGAYNGVPFHRVAPNFVIQGGDVESQDGFGGPDYVVPSETSALQYRRGKVGIASAGTDTEGSQYFVMHQWAPHLNGRYTIIGEVIEGMDVVDRIVIGDRVRTVYWD